jgi:V/A-type H+-transporting ATPase subunit E
MTRENTVENLEKALFERARRLGDEYMARARQTRERMIEEENERLRLREERETLAAEAEAERLFRRRVQAVELQLQSELDRHRWDLMEQVKAEMRQRFEAFRETEDYLEVLSRLLAEGVEKIGGGDIVAQLNATDRARVAGDWEAYSRRAETNGASVVLDETAGEFLGGVLVRSVDDTVRVDNTFEGRMDRLADPINQVIAEVLFPAALTMETRSNG